MTYAQKQRDQIDVQVDGLGCPFCAYGLEKKFKEFKGIKDIAIDIETGDFSFTYPAEKHLEMNAVLSQVKKAGYTPNKATIKRADGTTDTHDPTTTLASGSEEMSTFWVDGKCGMCKSRIENTALAIPGVTAAAWDVQSKKLDLTIQPNPETVTAVQKALVAAGHDLENLKAAAADYKALPPCCKYRRN